MKHAMRTVLLCLLSLIAASCCSLQEHQTTQDMLEEKANKVRLAGGFASVISSEGASRREATARALAIAQLSLTRAVTSTMHLLEEDLWKEPLPKTRSEYAPLFDLSKTDEQLNATLPSTFFLALCERDGEQFTAVALLVDGPHVLMDWFEARRKNVTEDAWRDFCSSRVYETLTIQGSPALWAGGN